MHKKIIYMLLCMYFIFNIQLDIFPASIGKIIYHIVPLVILMIFGRETDRMLSSLRAVYKSLAFVILLFLSAIIWGLLFVILQNGENSGLVYLFNAISGVLRFSALTVMTMYVHPKNTYKSFMKMYVLCNVIYVIFSIVFLLFPEIKLVWSTVIITPDKIIEKGDLLLESTRYGLAGYSGFTNTIFCSMAVWMSLYIQEMERNSHIWNFAIIVLLAGNMLYGRSGLIISVGILLFMNFRSLSYKRIKYTLISVLGCALLVMCAVEYSEQDPILSRWVTWVNEPMIAFVYGVEQGELSFGDSGNELVDDMYFFPNYDSTVFIGDGRLNNNDGSYYMHTDAGFMRQMLFYGLVGSFLSYASLLLLLFVYYRSIGKYSWHKIYVVALFFIMLLMEIKGLTLNIYYGVIFALLSSYSVTEYIKKER